MPKHSHLTLQDRSIICARINQGMWFAQIAEELEKAPSTISREVRLHRIPVAKGSYGRGFNPCVHRNDCKKTYVCDTCFCGGKRCRNCKDCYKHCPDFVEEVCPKLSKPPYVCADCKNKQRFTFTSERFFKFSDRYHHFALWASLRGAKKPGRGCFPAARWVRSG